MYKDYLPKKESIAEQHKSWLGDRIHDHNLWSFNIQSVPRGVAVGLFVAFIPLPIQMLLAVIFSALLRGNIPLAIASTWITNPVTFIPINYFIHDIGEWILNIEHEPITIQPLDFNSAWGNIFEVLLEWVQTLGKPFIVGLPVVAFGAGISSYILLTTIWYISTKVRNLSNQKRAE